MKAPSKTPLVAPSKFLWIAAVLVVVTAGVAVLLKSYRPAPTLVMKPSYFSQPNEIGAVVYRRFYVPIEEKRIVVFGIAPRPDWHQGVLKGFIETAAAENRGFDVVLAEQQMPELGPLPGVEVIPVPLNTSTQAELIDRLRELKSARKRVLIYAPSTYSSHLLPGNAIKRLERSIGEKILTISSMPLALRQDQEILIDPPCVGSQRDANGTAALGCATLAAGRVYYRKMVPQDRYVAIMNEQRPLDYLLMVSTPGQDQRTRSAAQAR